MSISSGRVGESHATNRGHRLPTRPARGAAVQVHAAGQERVDVVVERLVVVVQADVADEVVALLEHRALPRPECRHRAVGAADGHQLDVGIDHAHGLGRLGGEPAVLPGRLVAYLPRSVELVSQAPHLDGVRLLRTVAAAQVRQGGAGRVVAVLEQVRRLGDTPGAEVHRHHRLDAGSSAPTQELVDAEVVALHGAPGQVEPARALLQRADPVLPAVAGHEVATWVAHDRRPELTYEVRHVGTETVGVGPGMAGLEHAGVDAAAHVLDERAEQPWIDRRQAEGRIERQCGHLHGGMFTTL